MNEKPNIQGLGNRQLWYLSQMYKNNWQIYTMDDHRDMRKYTEIGNEEDSNDVPNDIISSLVKRKLFAIEYFAPSMYVDFIYFRLRKSVVKLFKEGKLKIVDHYEPNLRKHRVQPRQKAVDHNKGRTAHLHQPEIQFQEDTKN